MINPRDHVDRSLFGEETCATCPSGYFNDGSEVECTRCPQGRYGTPTHPSVGLTSVDQCLRCPVGQGSAEVITSVYDCSCQQGYDAYTWVSSELDAAAPYKEISPITEDQCNEYQERLLPLQAVTTPSIGVTAFDSKVKCTDNLCIYTDATSCEDEVATCERTPFMFLTKRDWVWSASTHMAADAVRAYAYKVEVTIDGSVHRSDVAVWVNGSQGAFYQTQGETLTGTGLANSCPEESGFEVTEGGWTWERPFGVTMLPGEIRVYDCGGIFVADAEPSALIQQPEIHQAVTAATPAPLKLNFAGQDQFSTQSESVIVPRANRAMVMGRLRIEQYRSLCVDFKDTVLIKTCKFDCPPGRTCQRCVSSKLNRQRVTDAYSFEREV